MAYNESLHAIAQNLCEKKKLYEEALLCSAASEKEMEVAKKVMEEADAQNKQSKVKVERCLQEFHLAEKALYPMPSPDLAPPIYLPVLEAELVAVEAELPDSIGSSEESGEEQCGKSESQKRREGLPAKFTDVDPLLLGSKVVLGRKNIQREGRGERNYVRREKASGLVLSEVIQKWVDDGCGTSSKIFKHCKDPKQSAWNAFLWEYGGGRLCFREFQITKDKKNSKNET